jgi:hypothetical protein
MARRQMVPQELPGKAVVTDQVAVEISLPQEQAGKKSDDGEKKVKPEGI